MTFYFLFYGIVYFIKKISFFLKKNKIISFVVGQDYKHPPHTSNKTNLRKKKKLFDKYIKFTNFIQDSSQKGKSISILPQNFDFEHLQPRKEHSIF